MGISKRENEKEGESEIENAVIGSAQRTGERWTRSIKRGQQAASACDPRYDCTGLMMVLTSRPRRMNSVKGVYTWNWKSEKKSRSIELCRKTATAERAKKGKGGFPGTLSALFPPIAAFFYPFRVAIPEVPEFRLFLLSAGPLRTAPEIGSNLFAFDLELAHGQT